MAKHHKFFWNGVDIVTSLEPEWIWRAVAEAIGQTKGKFTVVGDAPLTKSWDIKGSDTLFATSAELTFEAQISAEASGRRAVRTRILRTLLKESSVPFGPKQMLGQKSYMKVAHTLAASVTAADPAAVVSFREGPMPDGFSVETLSTTLAPPAGRVCARCGSSLLGSAFCTDCGAPVSA